MALTAADRSLVAVATETTYGADAITPTPAGYHAFRTLNIVPTLNQLESPRQTWSASGEKSCGVKSHNAVDWEMPMTGRLGAAGTAPSWDAMLQACGFKKTVDDGVSVAYKPVTSNAMADAPSATLWQYLRQLDEDAAYLLKARGFRGNATARFTVGEEAILLGSGLALYDAWPEATVASPTPPDTYIGAQCMIVQALALTIGAVTYPVEAFEFSTGWQLTEDRTGEAGKGTLKRVVLTRPASGGRLAGSLTLVDGKTALNDLVTKWQAGALVTLSGTITNGTSTITIAAPNMQFGQPAAQAGGVIKYNVPVFFNRGTTGDDEISITVT